MILVLIIILIHKALIGLACLVGIWLGPRLYSVDNYLVNFHWYQIPIDGYWRYFVTWDAQHYLFLSLNGYEQGEASSNAFYPLWPYLIRIVSMAIPGHPALGALILANVLSVFGYVAFHHLILKRSGQSDTARASLILLLCCPGALFFSFAYSESLFLLLSCLFLICLYDKKYFFAAALSFAMTLTRPTGVLSVIPIVAALIQHEGLKKFSGKWLTALAPVVAIGMYFILMRMETGGFYTAFESQKKYYMAQGDPTNILNVVGFLKSLLSFKWMTHDFLNSGLDRLFFALFILALPFLWKKDRILFWYALPMGLIPAMIQSFMSYTRFFILLIAVFYAGGYLWTHSKIKWMFVPAAILLLLLQAQLLIWHINFRWAG